jgi:hypothetical protein
VTERDRPHPDAEAVERMERDLPAQSPAEEETRAVYQRLIQRIGDLELTDPDPGWEERAMERWRREAEPPPAAKAQAAAKAARRMRWGPLLGAVVAAAAALALLILRCGPGAQTGLLVAVQSSEQHRGSGAAINDTLRASAPMNARYVELRVYRDRQLIARCLNDPGGTSVPRCRREGGRLFLELVVDGFGIYEVRWLSSQEPLPSPGATGLEVDDLQARETGVTLEHWEPITVR